jgi:hypothetical protein
MTLYIWILRIDLKDGVSSAFQIGGFRSAAGTKIVAIRSAASRMIAAQCAAFAIRSMPSSIEPISYTSIITSGIMASFARSCCCNSSTIAGPPAGILPSAAPLPEPDALHGGRLPARRGSCPGLRGESSASESSVGSFSLSSSLSHTDVRYAQTRRS